MSERCQHSMNTHKSKDTHAHAHAHKKKPTRTRKHTRKHKRKHTHKASPNNPYDKKFFAKEFNMPETDVESIHKVIREKYDITYPKTKDTSSVIRRGQLKEVSDTGLEQEYTKLKKGEQIGNPDLAHRVSKKYNVTTSNLGLDNPLINRVIVKPNERDISRLYTERTKIEN